MDCAYQAFLFFTISWSLIKLMSIESVMPSNYLIFCCPLLLSSMFPASGSFPMSQFFTPSGQSIVASGSALVLPMYIQAWFPLKLTVLIPLLSKRLSRGFSRTTIQKHQFINTAFFVVHLPHPYMTTGKPQALIIQTFVSKVIFLLFNTLSRFVIAFLPRSKCLFISKLQSWSVVILEP